jgi:CRP-like cAMP-binding protein
MIQIIGCCDILDDTLALDGESQYMASTPLQILKESKATQNLSTMTLRTLADHSAVNSVRPPRPLWKMGDASEFAALVLAGGMEMVRTSPSGHEFTMGFFGPGDMLGLCAVAQGNEYPCTARPFSAETKVLKIRLKAAIQNKQDSTSTELSTWISAELLTHQRILRDKVDILSAGKVEHKVCELLRQLQRRFGTKGVGNADTVIPLRLTKTQIGRLVDARVETVIRLFSIWKKAGLVSFEKNSIHILSWRELESSIAQDQRSV